MEQERVKGGDVRQTYFVTIEDSSKLHRYKECSRPVKQDTTNGYATLVSRVTILHKDDYVDEVG